MRDRGKDVIQFVEFVAANKTVYNALVTLPYCQPQTTMWHDEILYVECVEGGVQLSCLFNVALSFRTDILFVFMKESMNKVYNPCSLYTVLSTSLQRP